VPNFVAEALGPVASAVPPRLIRNASVESEASLCGSLGAATPNSAASATASDTEAESARVARVNPAAGKCISVYPFPEPSVCIYVSIYGEATPNSAASATASDTEAESARVARVNPAAGKCISVYPFPEASVCIYVSIYGAATPNSAASATASDTEAESARVARVNPAAGKFIFVYPFPEPSVCFYDYLRRGDAKFGSLGYSERHGGRERGGRSG